jgi:hypothetical protein
MVKFTSNKEIDMRKTKYVVPRSFVTVEHSDISPSEFETNLGNLKTYVEGLIQTHGSDAYLDYGQHQRYDVSYTFVVRRPETDEEYAIRCVLLNKNEELLEANAFAEYKRLKEKYEGNPK